MPEHHQDRPQPPSPVALLATPTAEHPQIVATQATPVAREQPTTTDFFSFDPTAVPEPETRSSRTPSVDSSASSSRLRDAVLDLVTRRGSTQLDVGPNIRPTTQRDLSHVSATSMESSDSTATVLPPEIRYLKRPGVTKSRTVYPNQAFSALHHQQHPPLHQPPPPDARPGLFQSASSSATATNSTLLPTRNARTSISPGLYTPSSRTSTPLSEVGYASPYLHHLHTQIPKETHVADIDVDPISGRKLINDYEVIDELGRGTHGKVKLGRALKTGDYVAIKIVERLPKKRRLGRLGNDEDKVKREVAILKKARHPNVVALLEVIDDPARSKVYIILERVDMGEIPWRSPGTLEIAIIEYRRYERESKGIFHDQRAELEDQAIINLGRIRRAKLARQRVMARKKHDHAWSLELAGDYDEDVDFDSASAVSSSIDNNSGTHLHQLSADFSRIEPTTTPAAGASASLKLHPAKDDSLSDSLSKGVSEDHTIESYTTRTMNSSDFPPLRPVITQDDVDADIPDLTRSLSHSNLAARAAEILDCELPSDLQYVPCMSIQAARETFRDTLLGLQYLHYQGIIHRDIKPPNLLQTRDYRTKISDFGVSFLGKPVDDLDNDDSDIEPDFDEAKELAKNVGTAAFYAPELCYTDTDHDCPPVGKGIDVWALGVTLFCMIFARVPFVDTEYVVMRRIAEEEVYVPQKRLRPVNEKTNSRTAGQFRYYTKKSRTRGPNSLEYEELDDTLIDLLHKILTKDVRKRATLDDIRHHPWVVEDLNDKTGWLDMSAPANTAEGKKIEISREDVEASVVPINLLDKIKSSLKKAAGSVAGLGRSSSLRKRNASGESSAASASTSNASSAVNLAGRRGSLRGDEAIVTALKASRDTEHPLSHSLVASPVSTPLNFPRSITTSLGTPRVPASRASPIAEHPVRSEDDQSNPTESIMSTTGSTGTIKPSDERGEPGFFDHSSHTSPTVSSSLESGQSVGLIGGAVRLLKTGRTRSTTRRSPATSRRSSIAPDGHGGPSVAVSTASAEGVVDTPWELRGPPSASSRASSPALSRRPSVDVVAKMNAARHNRDWAGIEQVQHGTDQKPSSSGVNETDQGDYARAEESLLRRQIAEGLRQQEQLHAAESPRGYSPCPPSPDDNSESRFHHRASDQSGRLSIPPSIAPSLEGEATSPSSSVMPLITPVSSEDRLRPEPADISNPALPAAISLDAIAEDPTVLPHDPIGLPPKLGEQTPGFLSESDDEDSSDDDGGLQMMRRHRPAQKRRGSSRSTHTTPRRAGSGRDDV